MAEATGVSVRECVGAALRFSRENARFVGLAALIGAGATALVTAIGLAAPQMGLLSGLANGVVQACVYAAFIGAILFGLNAVTARVARDGVRLWSAMVVIAFFLFIVFFILTIPVMIALFAGPLAPYMSDLQAAGQDQAQVLAIMTRFAEANPGVLLLIFLIYATLWLLLTSRLFLAAPASIDAGRILTFETWGWTKGAMLKIAGARLLLLLPANILSGALGYIAGRAFGVDAFAPAAAVGNVPGLLAYVFVASFVGFALYAALEAGLSTAFYRALKPAARPS